MDRKTLLTVRRCLARARLLDNDITVQKLQVLLEVAAHGEMTQGSLVRKVKQHRSSACKTLQQWGHKRKSGPRLISSAVDPDYLVSRILTITPDGEQAVKHILGEPA